MGSFKHITQSESRNKIGKINASLDMMLSSVKWGKYIIGEFPCLTSDFRNQGLNYYVSGEGATILKHVISIPSNSDVYRAYYQSRNVQVFSGNTTTIDMFGSAKYRNYEYGGDDHVAVVHAEKLPKYASIFVTTAIVRLLKKRLNTESKIIFVVAER